MDRDNYQHNSKDMFEVVIEKEDTSEVKKFDNMTDAHNYSLKVRQSLLKTEGVSLYFFDSHDKELKLLEYRVGCYEPTAVQ